MLLLSACVYCMGTFKEQEGTKVREEEGVAEDTVFISIKGSLIPIKGI